MREEIYRGLLANDIIGFHTTAYCRNFLHCCRELMELEVDYERGAVLHSGRETWVRAYPLGIDARRLERAAASPEVAEYEQELLRRRRDHLILRVDRADLSKNVLRGFTAFDTFLQQHPEFRERVTFIAHLQPSRTDVPEYAEYLERIEALVAVVNHRHGTTDWMPIDLRIYENFPEAVARYKHFDLLMVNSLFDGMNLVAKEAPAVNTRDGVVMLSENTGAHEELGDCTLSVNPFDIQEQADTIHRALTMDPEERALRAGRLREIVRERDPGVWIDEQLADIAGEARGARGGLSECPRAAGCLSRSPSRASPSTCRPRRGSRAASAPRLESGSAAAGGGVEAVAGAVDPVRAGEAAAQVEPAAPGARLDPDPAARACGPGQPDVEADPAAVLDRVAGAKAQARAGRARRDRGSAPRPRPCSASRRPGPRGSGRSGSAARKRPRRR